VLSGATLAVEVVTGGLLSLVLTFFFVKDGDRIGNWFARQAGSRGDDVRAVGRRAFETLGAYLRGQATVGLIDGVFIGIGLAVVGVPLAVPLAFLVFLGAFLPIVGAFLSGLIAALVALVSKGLVAALIIVGITIFVQQLEGHVLAPLVLGRAVKLHPVVILLALTGGGVVGGIIGAALAVPAVAVVTSVGSYLREHPDVRERLEPSALRADGRAGVPHGQGQDRRGQRQREHDDQHQAVVEPGNQPVGDGGDDRGGGDGDHPRPYDPPGDPPADR
jgi:predicted PurR-regulated permease PerM